MEKIIFEGNMPGKKRKPGDVGFDLEVMKDTIVPAMSTVLVMTDTKVALPYGTEMQVRSRSGVALKGVEGIPLLVIDKSDYIDGDGLIDCGTKYGFATRIEMDEKLVPYPAYMYMKASVKFGTVDPDFPNRVGIIVESFMPFPFLIKAGYRLAQGVFNEVVIPQLVEGKVEKNENREGGFGSSGNR